MNPASGGGSYSSVDNHDSDRDQRDGPTLPRPRGTDRSHWAHMTRWLGGPVITLPTAALPIAPPEGMTQLGFATTLHAGETGGGYPFEETPA